MTRVIFPFGSTTIIDIDCGSTKSVESPRNGMMPAMRPEYAVDVAGVVSATTMIGASVESRSTTLRPTMSLTRTRPARQRAYADDVAPLHGALRRDRAELPDCRLLLGARCGDDQDRK